MILRGARVARGPRQAIRRDVSLNGSGLTLDLEGHLLLPGLINAHDHLEFNLFPQLGRGPYRNAAEWARDIYHPDRSPIREHLRVPKPVRLWWGALKNLMSGVTTVCHHNPYEAEVFGPDFPVRVVKQFSWAHSLDFSPDLAMRFRTAPPGYPFVVHCSEGTDSRARREVPELDELGVLSHRTVLVHGVGLTPAGLQLIRRRRSTLVWCPTSNLNTLGRTISAQVLKTGVPVALGTDSSLTAGVDLLDELKVARRYVDQRRLYEMVTQQPARILRIPPSSRAGDWIAVRSGCAQPDSALLNGSVDLVVVRGRIRLIGSELARQLPNRIRAGLQPIAIEGRPPVLVDADVRSLHRTASKHLGRVLRLAGKRVEV